jgi:hypothetical protein
MALASALVDRARIVRRVPNDYKVDGETGFVDAPGPWFKARLTIPESEEAVSGISSRRVGLDASTQRRRVVKRPTLMFGTRDSEGQQIVLTVEDKVEVDSRELGTEVWLVSADPGPIRAKRKVLGYTVTLRRIEDHEQEQAVVVTRPAGGPRLIS